MSEESAPEGKSNEVTHSEIYLIHIFSYGCNLFYLPFSSQKNRNFSASSQGKNPLPPTFSENECKKA